MKRRIVDLYRRLDALGRRRGARIALSVLALLAVAGVFVPLQAAASGYVRQRTAIVEALAGQSLQRGDPAALQLRDRGTVTIDGVDYGGERVARLGELLFDAAGEVAAPERLADLMLLERRPGWVPEFLLAQSGTAWTVALLALVWLQLIVWLGLSVPFAAVLLATAAVALPLRLAGFTAASVAVGGIGLLTFSFVLLIRLALLALDWRVRPLAVAHTVVKEATRLNISLAFIVAILVLLPLLPIWIDAEQPLRYQVQTFISRSLSLTYAAAACMTLLLACATVAFEIRDRQIWQLMTKPLDRLSYLFGKFLGVAVLNAVLLVICGLSIFVFVQYLRTRPAADAFDAAAVRDEVLVARSSARPIYDAISRDELIARVDERLAEDAIMKAELESGARKESDVRRELALRIQTEHLQRQRQVPAGEVREYVFPGLAAARATGAPLTLRYNFFAGQSDPHRTLPVMFEFDGLDRVIYRQYVPVQGHVLTVPGSVIDEEGTVRLRIYNSGFDEGTGEFFPGPLTINFDAEDLELLYKVSGFEWNFLRAVVVLWIKLAFLAMLGVCTASILSFPVACILSFTVFLIGSMAPFLSESLEYYTVEAAWRLDQWFVVGIASASEWMMRSFGSLRPTQALVEGRLISISEVAAATLVIGLAWTGVSLLLGWIFFRNKELAMYSGNG